MLAREQVSDEGRLSEDHGDTRSEECDFGREGIEESATDRSASEHDHEKSWRVRVW